MPRFEPDFTKVDAQTPVWEKGRYELTIDKVGGRAYDKTDEQTGKKTHVFYVDLRPKIVGIYNAKGKLETSIDDQEIAGKTTESIRLYLHSQGAQEFSKRVMMPILGYNEKEEDDFNNFIKDLDLSFESHEKEGEEGYTVEMGPGWQVFVGKNVVAQMSKGVYKNQRTGEERPTQEFENFYPVG